MQQSRCLYELACLVFVALDLEERHCWWSFCVKNVKVSYKDEDAIVVHGVSVMEQN